MQIDVIFKIILNIIKWPLAFVSFMFLPAFALSIHQIMLNNLGALGFFGVGCFAYILLWHAVLKRLNTSYLSTLEHELTHSIFALLTWNKVRGLKVTNRDGGHVVIAGAGNWLIDVAPYFFPTLTVALLFIIPFFRPLNDFWSQSILGFSLVYHLISTWDETHSEQTDLIKAGKIFCWLFLPTSNLALLGLTLSVVGAGTIDLGAQRWFEVIKTLSYNEYRFIRLILGLD